MLTTSQNYRWYERLLLFSPIGNLRKKSTPATLKKLVRHFDDPFLCATLVSFLLLVCHSAGAQPAIIHEEQVQSGTNVRLHLRGGGVHIYGAESETLSISLSGSQLVDERQTHVVRKASGNTLSISLVGLPKDSSCQVLISIPRRARLGVRMRGGALQVEGMQNDLDLRVKAGSLKLKVGKPDQYSTVDLSARFGAIEGSIFGPPKGWMGPSVHWRGPGSSHLYASVVAGALKIEP